MELRKGQRVTVPLKGEQAAGTVAYVRMAPPSYDTIAAVSVVLDCRRDDPGYTGSVFAAEQVTPVHSRDSELCPECGSASPWRCGCDLSEYL